MALSGFNLLKLVREDLQSLIPYDAPLYPGVVKLDANENPYDFPREAMEEIFRRTGAQDFSRYPDPGAVWLRRDISAYINMPIENIMVGNGSDELILNIALAFGMGGSMAVATPTFSMYALHGQVAGTRTVEVPRREDFGIDVEALIRAAADPAVRIVVICTPNNPTANACRPAEIEQVLAAVDALVVVDEAYVEFGGESCIALLESHPNLVVMRTFSKAFGLAGLRVGYLLAAEPVMAQLLKVKQPYNVNAFSQLAARVVLACGPLFKERIASILGERDRLLKELSLLPGVEVFPSDANFILFRTMQPAAAVYEGLLRRGVLIRNVSGPALANCLRVTVGRPEENALFLSKLIDIIENKAIEEGGW